MIKKCDAKCDAWCDATASGPIPHLWLRNKVFYCRLELPRVEGKRRYNRYSLHTTNYYEAMEQMVDISRLNKKIDSLYSLYKKIKFVKVKTTFDNNYNFYNPYANYDEFKVAVDNNPDLLRLFYENFNETQEELNTLKTERKNFIQQGEYKEKWQEMSNKIDCIKDAVYSSPIISKSTPKHTIQSVLKTMLLRANNCKTEETRKGNFIKKAIDYVGLKLDDDYSEFHKLDVIDNISKWILSINNVGGSCQNKYQHYIKEFVNCACNMEPDFYKTNIIANMPKIEKTKRSERNPHLPYSQGQLLKIFDTNKTFFNDNPDLFWICLIALFTGARHNATITLQYGDVYMKDGLSCIEFRENHPIKQLKNDASERIVPIHKQLLDLGFIDYINRKKTNSKAKDEDFIFPKCITKGGKYNNKYLSRDLMPFFTKIGVKKENNDGYDFHSFRKNISVAMQNAGIIPTYINDIIGWEGRSTMEQSYSNHTLSDINTQLNKFSYDFLQPCFNEWKKIMAKK